MKKKYYFIISSTLSSFFFFLLSCSTSPLDTEDQGFIDNSSSSIHNSPNHDEYAYRNTNIEAFRIRTGESLTITFRNVPPEEAAHVNGTYTVDEYNGSIRLPHLDKPIRAVGQTYSNLEKTIEKAYRTNGIYRQPFVEVKEGQSDRSRSDRYITVGGYITKPGALPWTPTLKLFEAITQAGGANRFGTKKRAYISRGINRYKCNLTNIKDRNIKLMPGDIIEIPKKPF